MKKILLIFVILVAVVSLAGFVYLKQTQESNPSNENISDEEVSDNDENIASTVFENAPSILISGFISKDDLEINLWPFSYITGARGTESQDLSEFTLSKYDINKNLIETIKLNAYDRIMTDCISPCDNVDLDFWAVSTEIYFNPEVVYISINYAPEEKEIYYTNIHAMLVKDYIASTPGGSLTEQVKDSLTNKANELDDAYANKDIEAINSIFDSIVEELEANYVETKLIVGIQEDKTSIIKLINALKERIN